MRKIKKNECVCFVLLFFATGCVVPPKKTTNITKELPVKQAPSVAQENPKTQSTSQNFKDSILTLVSSIESSFLDQNCDAVLESTRILESLLNGPHFSNLTPLAQAGIYVCDAQAGKTDVGRIQKALSVLKDLPLHFPVINEPWIHNTMANFYLILGEKENAVLEKKQVRDFILAQQQDVPILNSEILKINPSDQTTTTDNQQPLASNPADEINVDKILLSVNQLINNDSPEQAIALLDSIPKEQRTENVKRLRIEALNVLVMNLRYKVRALFVRSTQQTGSTKRDTLVQCEQILKGIVQNYPEYSDMDAVKNNLKQVQIELEKLGNVR